VNFRTQHALHEKLTDRWILRGAVQMLNAFRITSSGLLAGEVIGIILCMPRVSDLNAVIHLPADIPR